MRKRGPKNSVEKQAQELISQINKWLLDEKLRLEDIVALIEKHPLKSNDVDVSLSSLNRYQVAFDRERKRIQKRRELLHSFGQEFSFEDESQWHSILISMLSEIVFDLMEGGNLKTEDVARLSKSLKDMMGSIKDREKIKEDLRAVVEKEIKQAQANKLKTAKAGGKLSKRSFEDAMRILGLQDEES